MQSYQTSYTTNPAPVAPMYYYPDEKKIDWDSMPAEIVPHAKAAQGVLRKYGMERHEARIVVLLDVSASMQQENHFFSHPEKGNRVQRLLEKALGMAYLFDDTTTIDVIPFGDTSYPVVQLTEDNFRNATQLLLDSIGGKLKSSTNYAAAISALRKHAFGDTVTRTKHALRCEKDPVFAIFVTDGEPNVQRDDAVTEFISASFNGVFIKMLALHGATEDVEFLNEIVRGEHGKMHIDNFDLVTIDDPDKLNMDDLIKKYRGWLEEAFERKMLARDPKIRRIDEHEGGRYIKKPGFFEKIFCCACDDDAVSEDTVSNKPR